MKKTVMKEVTYCDCCKKEAEYLTACMNCGIEHCYDCTKMEANIMYALLIMAAVVMATTVKIAILS